jgi:hypothetical protein
MLPFLQPAVTAKDSSHAPDAVTTNKLRKWAQTQTSTSIEELEDLRYEAYTSLVSNALRKAWVSWKINSFGDSRLTKSSCTSYTSIPPTPLWFTASMLRHARQAPSYSSRYPTSCNPQQQVSSQSLPTLPPSQRQTSCATLPMLYLRYQSCSPRTSGSLIRSSQVCLTPAYSHTLTSFLTGICSGSGTSSRNTPINIRIL